MILKSKLRSIVADIDITQIEIAKRVGISYQALNKIMKERSVPTLDTALKIAKVLDKDINEIWFLENEEEEN